jgi:hypothetical protein
MKNNLLLGLNVFFIGKLVGRLKNEKRKKNFRWIVATKHLMVPD